MSNQTTTMDERMSKHEQEFASRFSSAMTQMTAEGIELSLPIVVIEHIHNSANNLSVVRSQARKCAREDMPKKFEDDDYYFSLLKIKEVARKVIEKGVEIEKKELMMILRCKLKSANYAIYHELNNRIEHKLRISVYVFDKEGCIYPDKTASKTPLNITLLKEMFKVNRTIIRPKYVDNKTDRKRGLARQHARERDDEGDFPKEIKMGEILMPPYLWFEPMVTDNESTPGPKRLVGEDNSNKPSTSRNARQESTPDLRQRGLVGEESKNKPSITIQQYNQDHIHMSNSNTQSREPTGEYTHSDLNILLQSRQDQRSVLINEETIYNRRIIITDEVPEKRNVFERLGNNTSNATTTQKRAYSEMSLPKEQHAQPTTSKSTQDQNRPYNKQQRVYTKSTYHSSSYDKTTKQYNYVHDKTTTKQHYQTYQKRSEEEQEREYNKNNQQNVHRNQDKQSDSQHQEKQHRSKPQANRDMKGEQHNNKNYKDRVPERCGREEKGKDAHKRNTSRESQRPHQESSMNFYNRWQNNNQQASKRQHNQERTNSAKRPHYENNSNSTTYHTTQARESTNKKFQSSLTITNSKQTMTPLNLNITRRPLSPILNLVKKKVDTKTNNQCATAKPDLIMSQADNNKTTTTQNKQANLETKQIPQPSSQSENFENINESELPTLGEVSINSTTQQGKSTHMTTPSQEKIVFPEENHAQKNMQTINESDTSENNLSEDGPQLESTRDESQDPLLGELVIVSQPSDQEGTTEDMPNQEQEHAEETEITITAIIEEINRSISSKNSSMHEVNHSIHEVVPGKDKESSKQNTLEESQGKLTREQTEGTKTSGTESKSNNQTTTNMSSIISEDTLQENNTNSTVSMVNRQESVRIK